MAINQCFKEVILIWRFFQEIEGELKLNNELHIPENILHNANTIEISLDTNKNVSKRNKNISIHT